MSLADTVRAGVAIAKSAVDSLMVDVVHEVYGSQTVSGTFVAASSATRRAMVESSSRVVLAVDGREQVATTKVTFLDASPVTVRDRLTLPDGSQPPILLVTSPPLPSDGSPLMWEVYCGATS